MRVATIVVNGALTAGETVFALREYDLHKRVPVQPVSAFNLAIRVNPAHPTPRLMTIRSQQNLSWR